MPLMNKKECKRRLLLVFLENLNCKVAEKSERESDRAVPCALLTSNVFKVCLRSSGKRNRGW